MRSLFEILEDPKPLKLTITYDAPKFVSILVSFIADECNISENEVAQRLFNYMVGFCTDIGSGKPAVFGDAMSILLSVFPEIDSNGPLLSFMRRYVPNFEKMMSGGDSGFDFRKFLPRPGA